jgi:hypothetical protein
MVEATIAKVEEKTPGATPAKGTVSIARGFEHAMLHALGAKQRPLA